MAQSTPHPSTALPAPVADCLTDMARKKQRIQDLKEMDQEEKRNQLFVRSYEDPEGRTDPATLRRSKAPKHSLANQGTDHKENARVSSALGESMEELMEDWSCEGEFRRLRR